MVVFASRLRTSLHLQCALKGGSGQAVVACDMPEQPCKFSSLDSCQMRFLWTHEDVDLALRPVVSLVVQIEYAERFLPALGFKSLAPLLRVSQQGPCFTATEENGGDKRLVDLELA